MRVLLHFIRSYPWRTATALLALVVAGSVEGASVTALLPMFQVAMGGPGRAEEASDGVSKAVMGALETVGLTPSLGVLIAVVVAGLVGRSLLVLVANRHVGFTVARVATDLRLALLRALLGARWEYFLRLPVGTVTNAMSFEADQASRAYLQGARMAAISIQVLVYAGVALWLSWQATLAYLAAALGLGFLLQRFVRRARRAGRRQSELMRSLLSGMADNLQSVKSLKAMAREEVADTVLASQARSLNKALRREVMSKEMLKAAQLPAFALLAGGGAYLGIEVWGFAAPTVMVLLVILVRMLNNVGKVQAQYQNLAAAQAYFFALHGTIEDARRHVEPPSGRGAPVLEREIRLEDVHFRYASEPVLQGLDMRIPAGALTMLIGFSGSGKTTVVDLVTGLLRPDEGEVLVDGRSLEELDRRAWRRMLGYVPQESVLLHDSVLRNVTLGEPGLGEAEAERALRAAGAWELVCRLPQGLETVLGERGATLSGGQRQRILIARALVHEPSMLILDEATSSLDPESEADIWDTLEQLRGRITLLAISHRPVLTERADCVYRLEKGRALAVGGRALHDAPGPSPGRA